jgi:hypothetical protein
MAAERRCGCVNAPGAFSGGVTTRTGIADTILRPATGGTTGNDIAKAHGCQSSQFRFDVATLRPDFGRARNRAAQASQRKGRVPVNVFSSHSNGPRVRERWLSTSPQRGQGMLRCEPSQVLIVDEPMDVSCMSSHRKATSVPRRVSGTRSPCHHRWQHSNTRLRFAVELVRAEACGNLQTIQDRNGQLATVAS